MLMYCIYIQYNQEGVTVTDFFAESLALQRIDFFARVVAHAVDSGECGDEDMELALIWIAELTKNLSK